MEEIRKKSIATAGLAPFTAIKQMIQTIAKNTFLSWSLVLVFSGLIDFFFHSQSWGGMLVFRRRGRIIKSTRVALDKRQWGRGIGFQSIITVQP